jgi:hypothetical protein
MYNLEILWQIIGFIALFFVFLGFKETDDRKLIIYLAIGSGIWWIHFWLLGLIAAAGINFFDIFKNLIGLKYEKNNYWVSFFIVSYIVIWIYSYLQTQVLVSFLPTLASILWAIAVFWFRGVPLRLIMMSTLFIWFIYNIIGGSYAGIASDITLIWASFYGIFKLKRSSPTSLNKDKK